MKNQNNIDHRIAQLASSLPSLKQVTVRVDRTLLTRIKVTAALNDLTLQDSFDQALRQWIETRGAHQ